MYHIGGTRRITRSVPFFLLILLVASLGDCTLLRHCTLDMYVQVYCGLIAASKDGTLLSAPLY
jgi:hypothetical protein